MRKCKILRTLIVLPLFACIATVAQDTSRLDQVLSAPEKLFAALDRKTRSLEEKAARQIEVSLSKLQRQEEKLRRQLLKRDSSLAGEVFGDVGARYQALRNTSNRAATATVYIRRLDSLTTSLRFLQQQYGSSPELQELTARYGSLQQKLDASESIRNQLQQRQQDLMQQFEKLSMLKELRRFRKHVYYYQGQLNQYRDLLNNTSKLEAKLLELAMKLPEFESFFAQHSQLASLFAMPGSSQVAPSFAGLQTRSSVNQVLVSRFGNSAGSTDMMQQNLQSAQDQLAALKTKALSFASGNYGNGHAAAPDFKPNNQKTKPFSRRLEYGFNVQSQKARYFFPVTSDMGLSLGYKLNDKSVAGIGLSSYLDWKLKGSLFISGGYERNYFSQIKSVAQLKDYSSWQQSGLLGLGKHYKAGKVNGELKLLWDFLSYRQVPRAQPIIFRVGYQLK